MKDGVTNITEFKLEIDNSQQKTVYKELGQIHIFLASKDQKLPPQNFINKDPHMLKYVILSQGSKNGCFWCMEIQAVQIGFR